MSNPSSSSRSTFVRISSVTALLGLVLFMAATASAGSGYAFVESVASFFGYAPIQAKIVQVEPSATPPQSEISSAELTRKNVGPPKESDTNKPGNDGDGFAPEAISGATYAFTSASGASLEDMSAGTTTLVAPNQDDTASPLFNIGFDFWLDGVRYTQFSANANGLMRLGATPVSTGFTNTLASATDAPQIAAYWDDLFLGINGKVHYKVLGSAPTRKLVIEWTGEQVPRIGVTLQPGSATYQAWLYESTGVVEFVYGAGLVANPNNSGYSVGIGSSATQFASISTNTPSVSYTITNNFNTSAITSGTKYTLTPNAPAAPTGFNVTVPTLTGMTLNWTDNATNEFGYAIYRSDDGGTTYNFIQQTAANIATLAVTSLIPGVTYNWRVVAVSEGGVSANTSGSGATTAAGIKTASTGNWNAAGTWSPSGVPAATDDVTIPDGVTVTMDSSGLVCNNLTVGGGTSGVLVYGATAGALTVNGSVTVNGGASFTAGASALTTHTLAVGGTASTVSAGSITNNGTFDMNTTASANVTFGGNINGALSGGGGIFDFFSITVNKGTTSTPMLDVTSVITMSVVSTSTARLVLTSGTFRLSSASTITPIGGSQTVSAAAGRLWLNNSGASYSAGSAGSPTVTGELRIDNGTFNYGVGNNTLAMSTATGILTINGGTLNMLGAVSFASNAGCQFNMSGGNFNVDPNAGSALAAGTAVFTIGASTTVNWTGGNVTIIDPHSVVAGTAWTASSGGNKLIIGGTLNIGDGTSTTASGALGNTTGFGLLNTMGVWNLNLNNRTNASTTRMARMTGNVLVFNQLSLQANSYLFMGSGTTGASLILQGDVVQGGTLAGTEPAGTQLIGTMQVQGFTGSQTVSGGGTYTNIPTLNVLNTGTGVAFTNTLPFVTSRVNAFTGSINPGSSFTIGRPTVAPVVQLGGFAASPLNYSAGSFTSLPTFDNTAVNGFTTYVYANTSSTLTTGAFNEMPAGPQQLFQILINDPDGVTLDRAFSTFFATFTLGNINTTAANLLTVNNTATTGITTGSATSYCNGPLARALPVSLVTGSTYTFPVGKSAFKMLELVNPLTNSGAGGVFITAEVFDANSGGTAGSGLVALNTNRYWSAAITSGAGNFTSTNVRLTDAVSTGNLIGQSATQGGTYNSIGGTLGGTSTILSTATPTSLGFFNIGSSAQLAAGTYTVGAGGNYATLTLAVADYNSKTVTGPVVFNLIENASFAPEAVETYPITINANAGASATNTLTIKPNAASTTMTGSSASALIVMNGADYVTIDGSSNGSTSRDLTMTNTNVGTSSAVIWGQTSATTDSATNNTVKNVNLVGSGNTQTFAGVGFGSSTISISTAGTANQNNRIQNNNISKTQFGIISGGASAANKNTGTVITQNLLNTASPNNIQGGGIYARFESGIDISQNNIANISGSASPSFGISLGLLNSNTFTSFTGSEVVGATVSKNIVDNIVRNGDGSAFGIGVASVATLGSAANTLSNNAISRVRTASATPSDFPTGILLGGGVGSNTKLYFNSVSASGVCSNSSPCYGIVLGGSNPVVDLRNNIFYNVQTSTTGKVYAIGLTYAGYSNLTSNYNDFFGVTSATTAEIIALGSTGTDLTFANFKAATGQDANSINVDPTFNSLTNLQLSSGSAALGNGVAGTGVLTDILGVTRSTGIAPSGPTMGAYEVAADSAGPASTYTAFTGTASTSNRVLAVTITDATAVDQTVGSGPRIWFRKGASGSYSQTSCVSTGGTPQSGTYNCTIDYSLVTGGSVAAGDTVQYYVAAQDTLGNVASTPSGATGVTPPGSAPTGSPNSYAILLEIASYPYSQDFETNAGGYTTAIFSGSANDWILGTPAHTQIASAHSGTKAWVTKLSGNYSDAHNASVVSPILNFSSLGGDPTLTFWQNFDTSADPDYDSMVLEKSTDGGTVWTRVDSTLGTGGTFNTANSTGWYNLSGINGPITGPEWTNTSTAYTGHASGWIQSTTLLTGTGGLSDVRLRWRFVSDGSFNGNGGFAIDDVSIAPPTPMSYVSSTTTQNPNPVAYNTTNQQVIGLQVVTTGAASPLSATSFTLNTNGTQSLADISNAKLWYTGTSSTFAATTQFGSTVTGPSGSYNITGSQVLAAGTNYFWLTYDISSSVTAIGHVVDAEFNSVTVGSAQTPTVTAPAGTNMIVAQATVPGANTNTGSVRQPLATYYGYQRSAAIYTAAELGLSSGSSISNMCWYVNSSSSPVNGPTKIYMKTTTDTSFTTATTVATEETGASLKYDATPTLTYAANSFQCLALTTPFTYSGNNLEVIVETNFGGTGGEGSASKQFRYSTATSAHQVWEQDTTPPTGVSTGGSGNSGINSNRPNIQFSYLPPNPTLTLNKHVINDGGGAANASAWTLNATGSGGFSGSGAPATGTDAGLTGSVTPGVQYTLSESGGPAGYSSTGVWSCTGTGTFVSPDKITLEYGQAASCTINNDDISYTLTYTAGAHGSLSGTSPQTVFSGSDGSAVTANADPGYHFVNWSDSSTSNPRTDTNVTADISVTANFAINTYTLTYTAGAHGSLTGTSPQTVNHGSDGTAVSANADPGYYFVNWSDSSTANPRTDTNVTGDITVTANFTACPAVSIPTGAQTLSGVTATVPVNTTDITGLSVLSTDFTVTYNPAVLTPLANPTFGVTMGAVATSNGGGRTLTVFNPSAGTLNISVYGTEVMTGGGVLVNLNFSVVGLPGTSSTLNIGPFKYNEGTPCSTTSNGDITVIPGSITGTVNYGNPATGPNPRGVPGVLVSGAGSPALSDTTGAPGTYSLTGPGNGAYTVTPSKSGGQNGAITSFDCAKIAQYVTGNISLTAAQLAVADVTGLGGVTSFDAAMIARYAASLGPPQGNTGTWVFNPASRSYPTVYANYTGEDYAALLMGDVSGNWGDPSSYRPAIGPEKTAAVALPRILTPADYEVIVPVAITGASNKGVISYEFDLRYDPAVIQPQANPVDIAKTLSGTMFTTANAETPGLLRVIVYGALPLEGNGVLLNLKFTAVGAAGSVSPLTWESIMLNEGTPRVTAADGQVTLSAAAPNQAEISGRLLTATGAGVANSRVVLTDSTGQSRSILSDDSGNYRFGNLQVGQTYTISVESKLVAFTPITISVVGQSTNVDMIATQ